MANPSGMSREVTMTEGVDAAAADAASGGDDVAEGFTPCARNAAKTARFTVASHSDCGG